MKLTNRLLLVLAILIAISIPTLSRPTPPRHFGCGTAAVQAFSDCIIAGYPQFECQDLACAMLNPWVCSDPDRDAAVFAIGCGTNQR